MAVGAVVVVVVMEVEGDIEVPPHLGGCQDFKEDLIEGVAFKDTGRHLEDTTELNWNLNCSCLISLYLQNFIMMLHSCLEFITLYCALCCRSILIFIEEVLIRPIYAYMTGMSSCDSTWKTKWRYPRTRLDLSVNLWKPLLTTFRVSVPFASISFENLTK